VKKKTRHVDENECIPRWFLKLKETGEKGTKYLRTMENDIVLKLGRGK